MKYKRKPVLYDAYQLANGFWTVINLLTKEKKLMTTKEFQAQFEAVPDFEATPRKKYEPKQYPQLEPIMDEETGQILGFREIPKT